MKKLCNNFAVSSLLMVSPLAAVLLIFLVLPIVLIVVVSFWRATEFSIIPAFELDNYEFLFGSPVTYTVFFNTFKYALITWFFTVLLGFTIPFIRVFPFLPRLCKMALFFLSTIRF